MVLEIKVLRMRSFLVQLNIGSSSIDVDSRLGGYQMDRAKVLAPENVYQVSECSQAWIPMRHTC